MFHKALTVLFVLLFFLLSIFAQETTNHASSAIERAGIRMEWPKEKVEKVNKVLEYYKAETIKIKKKDFNKPENRRAMIQNIQKSKRTELSDILNLKELQKFTTVLKEEQQAIAKERKLSEEERTTLGKEIGEYTRSKVFPYIAIQRQDLEKYLLEKDKKEVKYLVEQIMAIQGSVREKQEECKAISAIDKKAKKKCKSEAQNLSKLLKPHQDRCKVVIENVQKDPNAAKIYQNLASNKAIWKKELFAIIAPYYDLEPTDTLNIPVNPNHYLKKANPFTFLTLNPNKVDQDLMEQKLNDNRQINLYSVDNQTNLHYEVLNEGAIKLEIYDVSGNLLQTFEQEQKSGKHFFPLNAKSLKTGVLICKLSDSDGETIKKLLRLD